MKDYEIVNGPAKGSVKELEIDYATEISGSKVYLVSLLDDKDQRQQYFYKELQEGRLSYIA